MSTKNQIQDVIRNLILSGGKIRGAYGATTQGGAASKFFLAMMGAPGTYSQTTLDHVAVARALFTGTTIPSHVTSQPRRSQGRYMGEAFFGFLKIGASSPSPNNIPRVPGNTGTTQCVVNRRTRQQIWSKDILSNYDIPSVLIDFMDSAHLTELTKEAKAGIYSGYPIPSFHRFFDSGRMYNNDGTLTTEGHLFVEAAVDWMTNVRAPISGVKSDLIKQFVSYGNTAKITLDNQPELMLV
jgi:hypothetical protein